MTKEDLRKMWECSPLLPPPGDEVLQDLLRYVESLRRDIYDLLEACQTSEAYEHSKKFKIKHPEFNEF